MKPGKFFIKKKNNKIKIGSYSKVWEADQQSIIGPFLFVKSGPPYDITGAG